MKGKREKPRSIVAICGAYYIKDAEFTGRHAPSGGISARYFVGDDDTEIDHRGANRGQHKSGRDAGSCVFFRRRIPIDSLRASFFHAAVKRRLRSC